jgi:hypothetical protein
MNEIIVWCSDIIKDAVESLSAEYKGKKHSLAYIFLQEELIEEISEEMRPYAGNQEVVKEK